jgi:hypothetical protein
MFNKYPTEFEEIHERIVINKEDAHKVIGEYEHIMEKEGIGITSMVYHLGGYLKIYWKNFFSDKENLFN